MVRVAGLLDQAAAGVTAPLARRAHAAGGARRDPRARARRSRREQAKLWKRQLRPALARQGIVVAEIEDLEPKELDELERRSSSGEIFPVLTPLAVGPGQPFPYISGLSLSLGLFVRDPETGEERFARVKVPELLPRFLLDRLARALPAARERDRALPRLALPDDGDRRVHGRSASRATPTSRSPTRPTTCSRRSSSSCGAAASARSCGSRSPARARRGCSSS